MKTRDERTASTDQVIRRFHGVRDSEGSGRAALSSVGAGRRPLSGRPPDAISSSRYGRPARWTSSQAWAPRLPRRSQEEMPNCATSRPTGRIRHNADAVDLTANQASRQAEARGIIDATACMTHSEDWQKSHPLFDPIVHLLCRLRCCPRCRKNPSTLEQIYLRSPTTGVSRRWSAFAKWTTATVQPLAINHQDSFQR